MSKSIRGREYITAAEVVEKTGLSVNMLSNYRKKFRESNALIGPRFITLGCRHWYDLDSVDAYLEAIGA